MISAVLIDYSFEPLTERIRAAVAKRSPDPIRFLMNTHWCADPTGESENLGEAGALFVAHDRTDPTARDVIRRALPTRAGAPAERKGHRAHPRRAGPHVRRRLRPLRRGGRAPHRRHLPGRPILPRPLDPSTPRPLDPSTPGSVDGRIVAGACALEMAEPAAQRIPGNWPPVAQASLRESQALLVAICDRVRKMIDRGRILLTGSLPRPMHDGLADKNRPEGITS